MRNRPFIVPTCLIIMALGGTARLSAQTSPEESARARGFPGAVYTMSNASDGNAILVFDRLADGRLAQARSVSTGGNGTGAGLGSQGSLVLTRNQRFLLAVNAGSDSLSVLEIRPRGLRLIDVQPSGGSRPISVTEDHGLVFVLNAGSDNITGYALSRDGHLGLILGSTRALSGSGTDPAQVAFAPGGNVLVATEKATDKIVTFTVDRDGHPGEGQVQASNGATPFGFDFGKRDQLLVSEAFGGAENGSAVSSYDLDREGAIETISGSVPTNQTAACWVVVTPNGRFAYTTNTGSGSISGYSVDFDGTIALLDGDGRNALTGDGSSPIDLALTASGRFLYSLNAGTGTIGIFRAHADGSLVARPFASGVPGSASGLAAR